MKNRNTLACLAVSLLGLMICAGSSQAATKKISGTISTTLTLMEDGKLVGDVTCTVVGGPCIVAAVFGDDTPFTVTSDVRPGTRSFPSFSAATAEIADARVFGGIHYRTSCVRGNMLGQAVAGYISTHAMGALEGD